MKLLKIIISILLINSYCLAQVTPEMAQKSMEAWGKYTGFEKEVGQAGDYLHKQIPENIRKPLDVIAGIADTINKRYIYLEYKYEF